MPTGVAGSLPSERPGCRLTAAASMELAQRGHWQDVSPHVTKRHRRACPTASARRPHHAPRAWPSSKRPRRAPRRDTAKCLARSLRKLVAYGVTTGGSKRGAKSVPNKEPAAPSWIAEREYLAAQLSESRRCSACAARASASGVPVRCGQVGHLVQLGQRCRRACRAWMASGECSRGVVMPSLGKNARRCHRRVRTQADSLKAAPPASRCHTRMTARN